MVTTNDLLTFFHVLMELTDAEVEIRHVDPDDGLVELRVNEASQGVWMPAPEAAARVRELLRFHYAEEDQQENLLEHLLHKSPVTTDDVLAYIKVMERMAQAKMRVTNYGVNVDEVEVRHHSSRQWMATSAAARYISEQLEEAQDGS